MFALRDVIIPPKPISRPFDLSVAVIDAPMDERPATSRLRNRLTLLYSRPFFEECLEQELLHSARRGSTVGILLCEVDQPGGVDDGLLRQIAGRLERTLRDRDVPAFYGVRRLAVLSPESTVTTLRALAIRLRSQIEQIPHRIEDNPERVTCRIGGLLTVPPRHSGERPRNLLAAAAAALAEARHNADREPRLDIRLDEHERRLSADVPARRFSRWLVARGELAVVQASRAAARLKTVRRPLGELAGRHRLLSSAQIDDVRATQGVTGERSGRIAVRLGYLTLPQLAGLIALQHEDPRQLADVLVAHEWLNRSAADRCLRRYLDETLHAASA